MADTFVLTDVRLVPMDGPPDGTGDAPLGHVRRGALRIGGDRIEALGDVAPRPGERTVDGGGRWALPGFVQGHVHCCQTLFRGLADGLPLLPWLEQRIWPFEHAHDEASTRASARLTIAALLRSGTTTVQTMESVRHTETCLEELLASPLTAIAGNCLMDRGDGVPAGMLTTAAEAMRITEALCDRYDGRGRLRYAVSPRFLLSCSEELLRSAAAFAAARGLAVHTHADEHPDEVAAVRRATGRDYLQALDDLGLLGARTRLAHCVHLSAGERELLRQRRASVLHCPSANLKLGSGIAPVADYLRERVPVALGADGAPCNNRLSALTELRQAALLQDLVAGPGAVSAARWLWQLTAGGAQALGVDDVGVLAPGRRADVLLFDLDDPELEPGGGVAQRIVYSADERHLRAVLCGGAFAVRDGALVAFDAAAVAAEARQERDRLLARAGFAR